MESESMRTDLDMVVQVARSLASVNGTQAIFEEILKQSMRLTSADGGTLYVVRDTELHFEIVRNITLGLRFGGEGEPPVPEYFAPISFEDDSNRVVLHVVQTGETANIANVYDSQFDFSIVQNPQYIVALVPSFLTQCPLVHV